MKKKKTLKYCFTYRPLAVVMLWCHMKSWRQVTSHEVILSCQKPVFHIQAHKSDNLGNHIFWAGDLWRMTLITELVRDITKDNPCTKFCDHRSNGSAMRVLTHWQTDRQGDRQTDGTISITSTADAGGKNEVVGGAIRPRSKMITPHTHIWFWINGASSVYVTLHFWGT